VDFEKNGQFEIRETLSPMSSLDKKIGELRGRIRRLVLVYGLGMSVAGIVGVVLILGIIDYAIRFRDPGMRVICSLSVLAVAIWLLYRYLYLGLKFKFQEVNLAKRLQRRFPALGDSLASAVEFQQQKDDDPIAGSCELRHMVINRMAEDTASLDFSEVVDVGPTRRVIVVALAVFLLAAIIVVWSPVDALTAVVRLANPFGDAAWSQKTHLALRKSVSKVARGGIFEVKVVDRFGVGLPDDVRIHYHFFENDGVGGVSTERMLFRDDAMVATLQNVTRPFKYRIEGGDDQSMAWHSVDVVDLPEIESLSLQIIPPEYTGWPIEFVDKKVRVLSGTKIRCLGRSTKLLRSAELCFEDGRNFSAQLMPDGSSFIVPTEDEMAISLKESISYWFRLIDREGIVGGDDLRREIRVVADRPPSVTVERPADPSFVTPKALVFVEALVKDDLAVSNVKLCVGELGRAGCKQSFPMYVGGREVKKLPDDGFGQGGKSGESLTVEYRLRLDRLRLEPGAETSFCVKATDYLGNEGISELQRLVVITSQQLTDRIVDRQREIAGEFKRILQMQRAAKLQVDKQRARLKEVGYIDRDGINELHSAELNQRRIGLALTSPSGVSRRILRLLEELKDNRVDSPGVMARMASILKEVGRLARRDLVIIGRELTVAIKDARFRLDDRPQGPEVEAGPESLAKVSEYQGRVSTAIGRMIRKLSDGQSYQRFHRDVGLLLREQEQLGSRTVDLGHQTLGRDFKDLRSTEVADLEGVARQQLELARRLERIMQEMGSTAKKLEDVAPLSAGIVLDALRRARELSISGAMRSAGNDVASNRIGRGIAEQGKVVENLKEILDILSNRRANEMARLKNSLHAVGVELSGIVRQQRDLQRRFRMAVDERQKNRRDNYLELLAGEQLGLGTKTKQIARRLEQLRESEAARLARNASEEMKAAGNASREGQLNLAIGYAMSAARELEAAVRQLLQKINQVQNDLAIEKFAGLLADVKDLYQRQAKLRNETRKLNSWPKSKPWEGRTIVELAQLQKQIRVEVLRLIKRVDGVGVFDLALEDSARAMERAAELLQRGEAGKRTQEAEENALDKLAELLESLKLNEAKALETGDESEVGQHRQKMERSRRFVSLSELRLLSTMQEEINRRTILLNKTAKGSARLTEQQRLEYSKLSDAQSRLADLVIKMAKQSKTGRSADMGMPGILDDLIEIEGKR